MQTDYQPHYARREPLLSAPLHDPLTRERYRALFVQLVLFIWVKLPKRGLKYYAAFWVMVFLWLSPKIIESRSNPAQPVPPLAGFATAVLAAGGFGFLASKFEDYHHALTDERLQHSTLTVETRAADRAVRKSHLSADVTYKQHQLLQQLPPEVAAQLKPANPEPTSKEDAEDLANKLIAGMDRPSTRSANSGTAGEADERLEPDAEGTAFTASADLNITADDRKAYQYFQGKIRGKAVLCIKLGDASHYCGVPIEDVARAIARDDKTVFLIGVTGVGKSLMTARAIGLAHTYRPLTDCLVMTHKTPNHADGEVFNYAGMENANRDTDYFEFAAEGDEIPDLLSEKESLLTFIRRIVSALKTGKPVDAPMLAVIDEYGNGLGAIKDWGAGMAAKNKSDSSSSLLASYKRVVRKTITQGNSNHVRALITSHSSVSEELEMNVDQRRNARFVYLGRGGELDSIESVLDASRKMMSSDEASELRTVLAQYKAAHRAMKSPENVVVALTNVGSVGWRLVVVSQNLQVERIEHTASNPPDGAIGFTHGDPLPETTPGYLPSIAEELNPMDAQTPDDTPANSTEATMKNNSSTDPLATTRADLDRLLGAAIPEQFTAHPEIEQTGAGFPGSPDLFAGGREPADDDLLGKPAPDWMTHADFHYLLNRLEDKVATSDGLLLSHFSNGAWPYKTSGGRHNPARLLEALRFFEQSKIVTIHDDGIKRLYFHGTDHIS
ncbi:MAG: hypothetical protein AAFV46_00915 [Cyanobacteria bacterium J06635_11]